MNKKTLSDYDSLLFYFEIFQRVLMVCMMLFLSSCAAPQAATQTPRGAVPSAPVVTITPTFTETIKPTVTQRSSASATPATATPSRIPPTSTLLSSPTLALNPTMVIPTNRLALTTRNAASMKRLARWGQGKLNDIAWSPDGKTLAVATGLGVYLYNTTTFQVQKLIDVDDVVTKVVFRPDGDAIATAQDTKVSVWGLESGRKLAEMEGEIFGGIWKLAYGKDGHVAALGQQFRGAGEPTPQVKLWQDTTGRLIFEERDIYKWNRALDISPDGKLILYINNSGLEVRDIASGKRVTILSDWENEAFDAVFSPEGAWVYFSRIETDKNWNAIWDLSTDTITELPQDVRSGRLTRNGDAVAHFGQTTGLLSPAIQGNFETGGVVQMAATSPDGSFLAYEGKESTIFIRETATGKILQTLDLPGFSSQAVSMAVLDGEIQTLAAVGLLGEIQVWDLVTGNIARRLPVIGEEVHGVAFSPDRLSLASVDTSRTVRIWDLQSGNEMARYQTGPNMNQALEVDGPLIYSPNGTQLVMITVTQENLIGLDIQAGAFHRLGLNPGTFVYAYSLTYLPAQFGTADDVVVWNVDFEQKVMILTNLATNQKTSYPLPPDIEFFGVETLALSADGKYLAAGVDSGEIFVWSFTHPRLPVVLKGHEERSGDGWVGAIRHLEFSPAANLLVSVGWDNITRLWDVETVTPLRKLKVCCYASFSPDGRFLVTAGSGVVRLWGIEQ